MYAQIRRVGVGWPRAGFLVPHCRGGTPPAREAFLSFFAKPRRRCFCTPLVREVFGSDPSGGRRGFLLFTVLHPSRAGGPFGVFGSDPSGGRRVAAGGVFGPSLSGRHPARTGGLFVLFC